MGWICLGPMVHGGDGGWSWWPLAHFASGATSPAAVGVHQRPSAIPWWHRAFLIPSVSLSFLLRLRLLFFSISTVKRVSLLPFLLATGVYWEEGRDAGLNRSYTNSPRLTAPPWTPRRGTGHCFGESAPPPQTTSCTPHRRPVCSQHPPLCTQPVLCLFTTFCLPSSHEDEPLPHPARCSNAGCAQLTPVQMRGATVAAALSSHGLGEPWHHPGTRVAPSCLCPGTVLPLSSYGWPSKDGDSGPCAWPMPIWH